MLVLPFDPALAGTPIIDGAFDDSGVWEQAAFADRAGERMLVNRLLIDNGAEAPDGDPSVRYTWFAMHDFTFLYLFVQFERNDASFTPIRDSGDRFFEDDAVTVMVDGDISRGAELDGITGNDRAFSIPLLSQFGDGLPHVYATRPRLAPDIPQSLLDGNYGVFVPDEGMIGWEMKIALADLDLDLDIGQPFGFEVQIDRDLDSGTREARWGWAYPSIATREGPFVNSSPALFGTATLASERL